VERGLDVEGPTVYLKMEQSNSNGRVENRSFCALGIVLEAIVGESGGEGDAALDCAAVVKLPSIWRHDNVSRLSISMAAVNRSPLITWTVNSTALCSNYRRQSLIVLSK
jgi:hypothetical protein